MKITVKQLRQIIAKTLVENNDAFAWLDTIEPDSTPQQTPIVKDDQPTLLDLYKRTNDVMNGLARGQKALEDVAEFSKQFEERFHLKEHETSKALKSMKSALDALDNYFYKLYDELHGTPDE